MNKLIGAAVLLGLCLRAMPTPAQETPQPLTLAENAFAIDLYGALRQQPGNLFFSPYSVATAIGMAYAGAKGGTAAEMAKVLHLGGLGVGADPQAAFLRDAKSWDAVGATEADGFQLHAANALWGAKGYAFKPGYIAALKDSFGAAFAAVSFSDEPTTTNRINAWVAGQTANKIQNLIPRGALDAATRLVLTNAIYFKAGWLSPFEPAATTKNKFQVAPGHEVTADMMNLNGSFGLVQQDNLKILDFPYRRREASLLIILPNEQDGLAAVESALTADNLRTWLQTEKNVPVTLALPKFEATSSFDLNTTLRTLGIRQAFDCGHADLTGIAADPAQPLCLSDVIHKAHIAVDEQGTEAAAATALIGVAASMPMPGPPPPPPVPFIADHPFLYLIRANQSGAILFMGRVADPTT